MRSADRERGARYKPRGRGLGPSNTKKYFTETNYKRVCPMRVERTTYSLGGCRSIQLSYEHVFPCQTSYFNFKCQENKKNFVALPKPCIAVYISLLALLLVQTRSSSRKTKKNKISVGWCLYFFDIFFENIIIHLFD